MTHTASGSLFSCGDFMSYQATYFFCLPKVHVLGCEDAQMLHEAVFDVSTHMCLVMSARADCLITGFGLPQCKSPFTLKLSLKYPFFI